MTAHPQLKPATELAKNNGVRFPNESGDYRIARDLLKKEVESSIQSISLLVFILLR